MSGICEGVAKSPKRGHEMCFQQIWEVPRMESFIVERLFYVIHIHCAMRCTMTMTCHSHKQEIFKLYSCSKIKIYQSFKLSKRLK